MPFIQQNESGIPQVQEAPQEMPQEQPQQPQQAPQQAPPQGGIDDGLLASLQTDVTAVLKALEGKYAEALPSISDPNSRLKKINEIIKILLKG